MKDIEFSDILKKEEQRQREQLQLIPSENYASKDVLNALGSVFTNKYSEGYCKKRYYQGNENIDDLENLAIERALKLFNSEYANVQPLSGSPANLAVYLGLLEQGETILSMNLASGGHLSHGSPVNIVSKLFNVVFYDVDPKTNLLDYYSILQIAKKCKPKLIIAGASAYPRAIDFAEFKNISDQVGALLMADIAHIAGLVVSAQHMSPVPFADVVTTTTHKTLRGPRGGLILSKKQYSDKISKAVFPGGVQAGPHNNVHAAKAVAFYEALQPEFKKYSLQVVKNAKKLAEELINFDFTVLTGGTDNHLLLIDITNKCVDGKTAAIALEKAGIVVNYNMIPYDTKTPFRPSGIRLGTPAVTSRGMVEQDIKVIAQFIDLAIKNVENEAALIEIGGQVREFASKFKVPGLDI